MKTVAAVLALWLCVTQTSAQSAQSCFSDVTRCLPEFRSRYLYTDYFWYGTPYATLCPGLPYCVNAGPGLQSVMSRVLWTNDTRSTQRAVNNVQILNVTFEQPARRYFACDTWHHVPPSPPIQVNPLGPTLLPQISTQTRPQVTWTPRFRQTLYTLVAVDTSYMFLHAFYINCAGGTLDSGQAVQQWMGTSVVYLVNSPYVFLVYEQSGAIPLQAAQQALEETRAEGVGISVIDVFRVDVLVGKLSAYLNPAIQFSVIMEMYPDPYGSSRLSEFRGTIDQCPLFYSQLQTFHRAVWDMRIPNLRWSPPAFSFSQVSTRAQLTSISVKVEVTYYTDEYECCQRSTFMRGSYAVSALDSRPVAAAMTRYTPRVFLRPVFLATEDNGRSIIAGRNYTLLMADVTSALTPTNGWPVPRLAVHWLVTNIRASDFETGTQVARYTPPSPSTAGFPRRRTFMFLLFDQPGAVPLSALRRFCPRGFERCMLRVTDLIRTWGLGDIVGVNWFWAP